MKSVEVEFNRLISQSESARVGSLLTRVVRMGNFLVHWRY